MNNGGHSRFIHNCGANAALIWADTRSGLQAMEAGIHAGILEEMLSWVEAEPCEAARQNGFEVRAERLDELDKAFHVANKEASMIDASARWILGWPELTAVDDANYREILYRSADMNLLRANRLV